MRVLFTTQPGRRYLDSMVPYAAAFQAAGHEVRVASSAPFARVVEAAGFEFTAIGTHFTWEDVETMFPVFFGNACGDQELEYSSELSWAVWNLDSARDPIASFDRWRPDVIVRESAENGATLAGAAEAGLALALTSAEIDADTIADTASRALYDSALRARSAAARKECEGMATIDHVVPLAEAYAHNGATQSTGYP
ncbi:hypothetical protein ACFWF7_21250 [Nocardia sp. NPDC060256]|uniref:hypothetical protein n=1 Tax=unclassified Nocardia TaxID=2637762 RepID=UPI003654D8B7